MQLQLDRALSPEQLVEENCTICGVPFRVETVTVEAVTNGRRPTSVGLACPGCIRYLGERNPARFSSIVEEYRAALRRYPEPMFASEDEVLRLEEAEMWEAFAASRLR